MCRERRRGLGGGVWRFEKQWLLLEQDAEGVCEGVVCVYVFVEGSNTDRSKVRPEDTKWCGYFHIVFNPGPPEAVGLGTSHPPCQGLHVLVIIM